MTFELLMIAFFGLLAGFVDAIAGGGGLIMLPGLLLSGQPVPLALGTNKFCGTAGAVASSIRYARHGVVDWRCVGVMAPPAFAGSVVGAHCVGWLPVAWAEPVVVCLLLAVTVLVLLQPKHAPQSESFSGHSKPLALVGALQLGALAAIIGFHDGFFGPGTGTFLVAVLLGLQKLGFLRATGTTKLVNLTTNVAALITFLRFGQVDFFVGIVGAIALATGSWIGAGWASLIGAPLIKPVFVVVTALVLLRVILFS